MSLIPFDSRYNLLNMQKQEISIKEQFEKVLRWCIIIPSITMEGGSEIVGRK